MKFVIHFLLGFLTAFAVCTIAAISSARSFRLYDEVLTPRNIAGGSILAGILWSLAVNYFLYRMRKQAAALEAGRLADEAKRLYEQRHAVEQENLKSSLVSHVSQSEYLVRRLTRLASSANNALDVAEQEFAEGVFAPFWDAVESAVKALANFSEEADAIVNHVRQYRTEAAMLVGTPPQFKVDIHTLPDASQVAKRMHSIVRRAQKSPHFAMIYEQRKTNQLLVAGFSNLAHAISGLGDRLERSLGYLTSEISDLASAQREATETLADELQHLREQNSEESDARRKHEEQEREMLDNIQRRRKPR